MAGFDIAEYQRLLAAVGAAVTNEDKGSSFESLVAYVFEALDGIRIEHRDANMASEEIDIVLWNAQVEEVLRPWDSVIQIECKNWNSPVGAQHLDSFIGKLRRRASKTGIFVAANGVTGGYIDGDGAEVGAVGIIRHALQEGIRVITITFADLSALQNLDELRTLIRRRYCGLYVHRVF